MANDNAHQLLRRSGLNIIPNSTPAVFDTRQLGSEAASAWISNSVSDDDWDTFLQTTPLGQFQQSTIWAGIKAAEGWRSVRIVIRQGPLILGGFQILIRSRTIFREGFLNKGPVYRSADPALLDWLLELVDKVARRESIAVLVCQTADSDLALESLQRTRGYLPNGIARIITATLGVPLGPTLPPLESRMRKTIRVEARQAQRRGVVVREGTDEDIPEFFRMMCITCRRQQTSPSPATAEALFRLWKPFRSQGLARLTIADCDGKPTAGLLALRFGNRVTQWKKGWTEEYREKHPNTLLTFESLHWAELQGATLYDFVGGERGLARATEHQQTPADKVLTSRYFFILGFGAEPSLLPLGRVLISNPLFRVGYQAILPLLNALGRVEK